MSQGAWEGRLRRRRDGTPTLESGTANDRSRSRSLGGMPFSLEVCSPLVSDTEPPIMPADTEALTLLLKTQKTEASSVLCQVCNEQGTLDEPQLLELGDCLLCREPVRIDGTRADFAFNAKHSSSLS